MGARSISEGKYEVPHPCLVWGRDKVHRIFSTISMNKPIKKILQTKPRVTRSGLQLRPENSFRGWN
jgi:hypothetical protein